MNQILRQSGGVAAALALVAMAWMPGLADEDAAGLPHNVAALETSHDAVPSAPSAPAAAPAIVEPEPPVPDLGAIRDAVAAYRRGDLAAGDRIRARIAGPSADASADPSADPSAGPMLDWVALRFGGPAVEFDRVLAFQRAYPDWPGAAWLRRRAEDALLAERKPPGVVMSFFAGGRPQSASGKLALAMALRTENLTGDAAQLVQEAWRNDTFGRELETRILDEFPSALTAADHRYRMERLLFRENWEGARRAADLAGKGYDALVKARVAVAARSPGAQKLLDAVPATLRGDSSYVFSRAQMLRRADKPLEAVKALAAMTRDPAVLADGDEWWVERRLIARKLLDLGENRAAYEAVEAHGAVAAEKRIEAEFMAGWIALRFLKDVPVATRHFARAAAIAATPISIARAAYWQGRAAEAAGSEGEARGFFGRAADQGTTYYGQLAAAKLGRAPATVRPPGDPAGADRVAAARSPAVRAIGLLYAAGLRDTAVPLLVELSRSGSAVPELDAAADIALEQRDARALLALGKTATQRGLPLDEAAFPTIGVPAFEPVGPRVEKAMVYAIVRQESAFDPAAGSGAGARGLMQLMPATAQGVARRVGVEYDPARLLDAVYNARLGAAFLGDLMEDWRGSFILTFASYNAGPGNVRKWIAAYGDPRDAAVDAVDWVERIPFYETRNYVQRVMENLQVYRKRLEERSALVTDADLRRGGAR